MNKNANRTASRTFASPLADPFKDWPNSDLLIDDEDRAFFTRHYPAFGPIFDWPELRALFVTYDTPAAGARKRSRRSGIFAILSGFLSLIVAAAVPLADEFTRGSTMAPFRVQGLLGGIAAVLAIVSIVVGYTQVLKGREKGAVADQPILDRTHPPISLPADRESSTGVDRRRKRKKCAGKLARFALARVG